MKLPLIALVLIITSIACQNKNRSVDLVWKINPNEDIKYEAALQLLDTPLLEIKNNQKATEQILEELNQKYTNLNYIATLSSKDGKIVDIVMRTRPKTLTDNNQIGSFNSNNNALNIDENENGVVLRGSVYGNGEIHSFWVKPFQKNMLAILFQLPKEPVNVGDEWQLDVSFISNDHTFKCFKSTKRNSVTLTQVKEVNGESIATLYYDISEYVDGVLLPPSESLSDAQKSEMKIAFQGIGKFSIENGQWSSFDGILMTNTKGNISSHTRTKVSLKKP